MHLLIPAAGSGRRMGSDRNKLLLPLMGKPLIAWTLQAAEAAESITWIGIVGQVDDWPDFKKILTDLQITKPVVLVQGGDSRQQSVYNGLHDLPPEANYVLIHDGARCLATPDLFNRCAAELELTDGGIIAAIPVKDTIKIVYPHSTEVRTTPDRHLLWAAQTPQGFSVDRLRACHVEGLEKGWEVTDDAALFEKCQLSVKVVMGEETNLKITTPMDLAIAEFILQQRRAAHNSTAGFNSESSV